MLLNHGAIPPIRILMYMVKDLDLLTIVQRTLAAKANLTFEFSKTADGIFNIRIFDPLGTVWYDGTDI